MMDDETRAEHSLEIGNMYPYDAPDNWKKSEDPEPPEAKDWAHKAARGILADLTDRRGIKQGFMDIDEEVRADIADSISEIIRQSLKDEQAVSSS